MPERFPRLCRVLALWLCLASWGYWRYLPPAPQPADVSASQFSAERALPLLKSLVGDGRPHPVGSEQNRRVRDQIVAHLRSFGYQPTIHRSELDDGTTVENVLARRGGADRNSAVALVAHYDSVDEGPGASDDGVGVAALLEVARMTINRSISGHDVIFLFSDGEEYGLLGSEAFLREHAWAREIKVVLNFDARGTSGPSLMFETSDDNAWLIQVLAHSLTRPVTSSIFDDVYEYLPNYTDFTSFLDYDIPGFNFAFIRNVNDYHTARDNFERVTPGSLQHHGDNAWQLTCALVDKDFGDMGSGNAVYTDLFASIVIWWRVTTGRIWASLTPALLGVVIRTLRRRVGIRASRLAKGVVYCLLVASLTAASGWTVDHLLREAGWFDDPWSSQGLIALALYWTGMIAVFFLLANWLGRGVDGWSWWITVWGLWSLTAVIAAWIQPGSSYLFLLPVTTSLVAGLLFAFRARTLDDSSFIVPALLGTTVAAGIWLPQAILLYDAVGLEFGFVFVLAIAALLTTVQPLLQAPWRARAADM